jgi:hypothetical protein
MQLPPQCIVVGDIIREKAQMSSTGTIWAALFPKALMYLCTNSPWVKYRKSIDSEKASFIISSELLKKEILTQGFFRSNF